MRPRSLLLLPLLLAVLLGPAAARAGEETVEGLNPDGSPWGPPPDPTAEPRLLVTPWGVTLVHDRGYPEVSLDTIEEVLYDVAQRCAPGPGDFHLQIYIEPTLFRVGEIWAAGATEETRIWVVGFYRAWDGREARYDELLRKELIEHVLECELPPTEGEPPPEVSRRDSAGASPGSPTG